MDISTRTIDGILVVELFGSVDRHAAGRLYDELVSVIGPCDRDTVLDLSGLLHLSRSATRAVVVAAKLLRTARKRLRISGANPAIVGLLQALGVSHLLTFDPTLDASLTALQGRSRATSRQGAPRRKPDPLAAITFDEFLALLRAEYAALLLDRHGGSPERVAAACGYDGADAMRRALLRHPDILPKKRPEPLSCPVDTFLPARAS